MQSKWLIRAGRDKLLLFVNGWGMDENPFQLLTSESLDVYMVYDYRNLDLQEDLRSLCRPYREIHLVAWSLGVWVCQRLQASLPERTAFSLAINGTLQPIHLRYGINPAIFSSTLQHLNEHTLRNFYQNMFGNDDHARIFFQHPPQRPAAEIIQELACLNTLIAQDHDPREAMGFDTAVIGNHDIIFPAKHQLRFWQNQSTCRLILSGHFPFYCWQRWEDMLAAVNHE